VSAALSTIGRPILNLIRGKPLLAIFEINLRCNSACGYCDLPLNRGRYEMTREEIARVGADLYRAGLRFLFVQGGEPLLRRDLAEILEDLHGLGFGLTLITNGTKFTPPLVRRLASLSLNLSVSLDTLDRDRYRTIRGADQLADVLAGLDLLRDFPHPKYLTTIVSEVNRDEVETMVRFAKARGFMPVVGAYHWGIDRYGKADAGLQYDRRALALVFEQVLASGLVPRGYFRQYLLDNVRWLSGGDLERCDAGRYSIAVDASGNVAPCLAQPFAGNLLHQSLSDILARFDREAIARCSDRSACNLLCSRVVGSILRHPVTAAMTPLRVRGEA
jgi:MoaA/NifB/PqqE/SkfB family radical SAM enzyme